MFAGNHLKTAELNNQLIKKKKKNVRNCPNNGFTERKVAQEIGKFWKNGKL